MVEGLRDPGRDKFKGAAVLKEQQKQDLRCMLADCDNPISMYEGPGSQTLCREHQLACVEYGGMGKAERPHTFYRNWVCESCGYDPREDQLRFGHIQDEYHRLRCMRGVMHGDHQVLQQLGGQHRADNIRTLCALCHSAKTLTEQDYLSHS